MCISNADLSFSLFLWTSLFCVQQPTFLSRTSTRSFPHYLSLSLSLSIQVLACWTDRSLHLSVTSLSLCLSSVALFFSLILSQGVGAQGVLREGVAMQNFFVFSFAFFAVCASFHFWQRGNSKSLQNWGQSAVSHTYTWTHNDTHTYTSRERHLHTHTHTQNSRWKWKISAKSKS